MASLASGKISRTACAITWLAEWRMRRSRSCRGKSAGGWLGSQAISCRMSSATGIPFSVSRYRPTMLSSMITLHMVSSLDGFIARPDNSVAWMHTPEDAYPEGKSVTHDEIAAFLRTIDCYVMGSRTYEHALQLGWPYGDTPVIVLTSRQLPSHRPTVEFYTGDLRQLVDERLAPRFRNIWLVGGALTAQRFLELGLVDEIKLTLAPV